MMAKKRDGVFGVMGGRQMFRVGLDRDAMKYLADHPSDFGDWFCIGYGSDREHGPVPMIACTDPDAIIDKLSTVNA